jgi:PAS domain S-box-containing protein
LAPHFHPDVVLTAFLRQQPDGFSSALGRQAVLVARTGLSPRRRQRYVDRQQETGRTLMGDDDKTGEQPLAERQALRSRAAAREGDAAGPTALPPLPALAEHLPDLIARLDRDLRPVYVNRPVEPRTGLPAAAFLGAADGEPGLPVDRIGPLQEKQRQVLATGQPTTLEVAVPSPGGEATFEVRLVPERGPGGEVETVLCIARDVTERARAEAALRLSEARYRTLVEGAHDVIYSHDLAGNVRTWSSAGERLLGYTAEEVRRVNIAQLVAPEQLEQARQMTALKLAGGGRTAYELEVLAKDGRRVILEISSHLEYDRGTPVGVQGIARDVTERKRAEEALQEADRRKDEFLATLAHELRNPLAPIRNALYILQMPGTDPAVVAEAHGVLGRQVQHLVRLVDDLLDVSRIRRDKIELRKERVELATVVARAVETARVLIDAHGHELTIALPPEPVWVEADLIRLAQVVSNLLHNAAKYTEPGGRISLSGGREGAEIVLRVRDTGVGIEPELLRRIFDPFVQAERSRARAQGGLGVGLTLVRKLAALHGGSVQASSTGLGRGSEFVVRLPAPAQGRHSDAAACGAEGTPAVPAIPRRRILVVDDSRDAAESLALLLRLEGHEVQVARDGPAALELARRQRPEVAFLDLAMPGMDGYELCRRLRAEPALAPTLLVALTGWGQEADRRRSEEAGFDRHLVKPVEPQSLRRLLTHPRLPGP